MREHKTFTVYILSNKNRSTFYVGVTNDIFRRMLEHKSGTGSKFTTKYGVSDLLYREKSEYVNDAIMREKQIKKWKREWKIAKIKEGNPFMNDLAKEWFTLEEIETYSNRRADVGSSPS